MRIQLWDKQGNSELVPSKEVQARLKDGWSYNEPSTPQKPSMKRSRKRIVRDVQVDEPVVLKPRIDVGLEGPEDLINNNEEAN
jgi:hypothetical protein